MLVKITLDEAVRVARHRIGSVSLLASACDCSTSLVYLWERGGAEPTTRGLRVIAGALGVGEADMRAMVADAAAERARQRVMDAS